MKLLKHNSLIICVLTCLSACATHAPIKPTGPTISSIPLNSKIIVSIGSIGTPPFDISNKVESILINSGYRIVDRSAINQVLREQKFSNSGLVDRDQQIALGKMSGADYLLMGTVQTDLSYHYRTDIQIRLLNLKTAEVVAAKAWQGRGYGEDHWQSIITDAFAINNNPKQISSPRQIQEGKVIVLAHITDRDQDVKYVNQVFGHPTDTDLCVGPDKETTSKEKMCKEFATAGHPKPSVYYIAFLENQLLKLGYKTVDRAQLDQLMREQHISASGLVAPHEQIEFGKLAGADYLLIADGVTFITPLLDRNVRSWGLKLINLKTSEIVSAGFDFSKRGSMDTLLERTFKDAFF